MTKEEIKKIRDVLDLTSKQLAAKLGVAHNTVRCWECGVRTPTSAAAKMLRDLQKKADKKLQPA
jgi:DNA-binding transcriptional regulator YiaG